MKPQVQDALAKAHKVRLDRAALRAEVERLPHDEALQEVARLIAAPPRCIWSLEAFALLQWCKYVKRERALHYCRQAKVSELALTGWLTKRQRSALCVALQGDEMEVAA